MLLNVAFKTFSVIKMLAASKCNFSLTLETIKTYCACVLLRLIHKFGKFKYRNVHLNFLPKWDIIWGKIINATFGFVNCISTFGLECSTRSFDLYYFNFRNFLFFYFRISGFLFAVETNADCYRCQDYQW